MSERTTIGGTVYETVGSSTSNLLLRCNGTARIQWGTKLIDLVKNGKIASGDSSAQILVVSNESDIKTDGIYVINAEKSSRLIIRKNSENYDFTDTELYISANNKQELTVEQQKQAMENIGMYYDTLDDVEKSGIQNGIVYVLEDRSLYTIKDGVILEFEAKLKTVSVEKENEEGERINSSVQVVLSVLDKEYLVLSDQRIVANYPIHVKDHVQLGSENANEMFGYRLYFKNGKSCLDVDTINVRQGLQTKDYIETTFENLESLISQSALVSQQWYLITNFQNHWKLVAKKEEFNRPILVRAANSNSIYKEGLLFNNRNVSICYDPTYKVQLAVSDSETITSRGRITWMRDWNNNEADFDFLDYTDAEGNALATLHQEQSYLDRSIFPVGSFNNKLKTVNLRGTVVNEGVIDNTDTFSLDFRENFDMHDNVMICKNIIIDTSCNTFVNNVFESIEDVTISTDMSNSIFKNVKGCTFLNSFDSVNFKNLTNCHFDVGVLSDITCYSDLTDVNISINSEPLLYDESSFKEIYFKNNSIQYIGGPTQALPRGMIVMHSGLEDIPYGWAICDGGTYEFNGKHTQTPNLVNRFIKAVSQITDIGSVDNSDVDSDNYLTITAQHLPEHTHPHVEHTHEVSPVTVEINESGSLELNSSDFNQITSSNTISVVSDVTAENLEVSTQQVFNEINIESQENDISGGNHTHTVSVSGGSITSSTSVEETKVWENKPIKIEPHYYSLIFIMKL